MNNPYNNLSVISLIEYWNSKRHYDNNEGLNWWASICRQNLARSKLPCVFSRRMSTVCPIKERNLLTFAQILINLSPCFIPADHRVAMAETTNSLCALASTQIQECIGSPNFLDIKSKLWTPALWITVAITDQYSTKKLCLGTSATHYSAQFSSTGWGKICTETSARPHKTLIRIAIPTSAEYTV
jgi:hypothetical protein